GMGRQALEPRLVVVVEPRLVVVDEHARRDVHGVDEHESLAHAARGHDPRDVGGDVDEAAAGGQVHPEGLGGGTHRPTLAEASRRPRRRRPSRLSVSKCSATVAPPPHPKSVRCATQPASLTSPDVSYERSNSMSPNALPEVVIISGARTPMAEWIGGKRGDGL